MKTLKLFVAALLAISYSANAQSTQVPENVVKAFEKKFPHAQSVKWDKENETDWEAKFKMNGREYSANFSQDGEWKETEYEIEKKEIPVNVLKTIETEFKEFKIEEAEISETPEGKVYEFELEKGKLNLEVVVSPDGKVLKKEEKSEKDQEKN